MRGAMSLFTRGRRVHSYRARIGEAMMARRALQAALVLLCASVTTAWSRSAHPRRHAGRISRHARSVMQLGEDQPRRGPDDDYNPPMSALDELVAREVAAAFDGEEARLLDADEELRQSLIEARVADVTKSVLDKRMHCRI